MPLYDFLCRDCETQSELLVRSSTETQVCPQCGGDHLMRLLSVPAAPHGGASSSAAPGPPRSGPCGGGCACH